MIWAVAALRPVDDRPAPNRSAAMRALSASPLCSPCVSDSVIRLDGRLERSNDQRGFGPRKGSRTGGAVSTARSFRFPHIRDNTLVGKDACRPGQSRERRIRNVGIVARRPGSGPRSALYRGIPGVIGRTCGAWQWNLGPATAGTCQDHYVAHLIDISRHGRAHPLSASSSGGLADSDCCGTVVEAGELACALSAPTRARLLPVRSAGDKRLGVRDLAGGLARAPRRARRPGGRA
jgi:hypothetical protein